jgi:hypothetical protein
LCEQRDKIVVAGPTCTAGSLAERRVSVQRPSLLMICDLAAPINRTKPPNYLSGCRKIP